VLLALVVVAVVADCKVFDGGREGSATKAQILKVAECGWVEAMAPVAQKERMLTLVATLA
jgi:hypothetical protein